MKRRLDIYVHPAPRRRVTDVSNRADVENRWKKIISEAEKELENKSLKPSERSRFEQVVTEAKSKLGGSSDRAPSFADEISSMIGGEHRPEGIHAKDTPLVVEDAVNGINSGRPNNDNPAQLRATGRAAQQYCDTTQEVREWARGEGYGRAQEAYIVEGFKQARIAAGLSENV